MAPRNLTPQTARSLADIAVEIAEVADSLTSISEAMTKLGVETIDVPNTKTLFSALRDIHTYRSEAKDAFLAVRGEREVAPVKAKSKPKK